MRNSGWDVIQPVPVNNTPSRDNSCTVNIISPPSYPCTRYLRKVSVEEAKKSTQPFRFPSFLHLAVLIESFFGLIIDLSHHIGHEGCRTRTWAGNGRIPGGEGFRPSRNKNCDYKFRGPLGLVSGLNCSCLVILNSDFSKVH